MKWKESCFRVLRYHLIDSAYLDIKQLPELLQHGKETFWLRLGGAGKEYNFHFWCGSKLGFQ